MSTRQWHLCMSRSLNRVIYLSNAYADSYPAAWLGHLAASFFGARDPKDLAKACADRANFLALRNFLRGLSVKIVPGDNASHGTPPANNTYRTVEIKSIVLRAGFAEFSKDGVDTTVQVGHPPDR